MNVQTGTRVVDGRRRVPGGLRRSLRTRHMSQTGTGYGSPVVKVTVGKDGVNKGRFLVTIGSLWILLFGSELDKRTFKETLDTVRK